MSLHISEPLFDWIMAELQEAKRSKKWRDKRRIPHPANWLKARGWEKEEVELAQEWTLSEMFEEIKRLGLDRDEEEESGP